MGASGDESDLLKRNSVADPVGGGVLPRGWIRDFTMSYPTGRHFLQIPGPTNVPDRVLRAIAAPTIDHRGPTFQALALEVLELLGPVFGTPGPVVIYPASGTGAWEAALVNTLSPGDTVMAFETGHFATLWRAIGGEHALVVGFCFREFPDLGNPHVAAVQIAARTAPDRQTRARVGH